MDGPRLDDSLRREKFNPTQYITTVATSDDDIWELKQIFDLFDINHRGFISFNDIQVIKETMESADLSSMEYEDSEAYKWMCVMENELMERQDEVDADTGSDEDLAHHTKKDSGAEDEDAKSIFSMLSTINDNRNDAPWKEKEHSKLDDRLATPSAKKQEVADSDVSFTPSPTPSGTRRSKAGPRMVTPPPQPPSHVRRDSRSSLTGQATNESLRRDNRCSVQGVDSSTGPVMDKRGITFDDFLQYMIPRMCEDDTEDRLRDCWDLYFDKEQNESVTVDELEQVARAANIEVSLDELEDMIDHADENLDGLVTFEDFCNVMVKKA